MSYDHNDKSGNRGDVVKHIALVAALDSVLDSVSDTEFRYADTFAGYANNLLTQANKSEDGWGIGIGALIARKARFSENPHIEWWANRYLVSDNLEGTKYPGSSRVAKDVCEARDKSFHAALWDTSLAVVADLKRYFGPDQHRIADQPARPDEEPVRASHFLFIDPPGLKSDAHPEYPSWETLRQFIELSSVSQHLLIWLPIKAVTLMEATGKRKSEVEAMKPPGEDSSSWDARNESIRLGCRAIRVRWSRGGRTIGCHLLYRLPTRSEISLRVAVEKIVDIAGWKADMPTGVQTVIL